jgi:hypothetical protein
MSKVFPKEGLEVEVKNLQVSKTKRIQNGSAGIPSRATSSLEAVTFARKEVPHKRKNL